MEFSLNLCEVCQPKMTSKIKQLNVDNIFLSERALESEIRIWLYENYNLPENIRKEFQTYLENDVETDFE